MCSMQQNPTTYLHKDFAHIRSMTLLAIVRATLPHYDQGNSRRPKGSAKEPSFCGHNRSSCKAFGKSVTTKEHSGLSQALALCPPAHTPMGRWRQRRPWKGKEYVLGCKWVKTLAMTLGGVWEKGEKKLPPEMMMMVLLGPSLQNNSLKV